jgi:hypothetical protein
MYFLMLELFKSFYKEYYKFMTRIIFWRNFNYDRQIKYAEKNGYIASKKTVGFSKSVSMWWYDISTQQVTKKEMLFDKVDFVVGFLRLLLILVFCCVIAYFKIITLK